MRFVTLTRFNTLEQLIRTIPDPSDRSYALHLLQAIRDDIDVNYAEIQRPIRLGDFPGKKDGGDRRGQPPKPLP
jgi:hypothetical protein